jgi:predicted translin family RNA/ssDNA-binding protein
MAKWDYNLSHKGSYLRELINNDDSSKENCENILNQIIVCCQYLQTKLSDEDRDCYEYDLEEMVEDCEDTKAYLDEFDEESNEDNINDMLEQFYDLMDTMRVWIPV